MSRRFECAVAIPAHNALPDVLEAIESALGQTLPPVEIVVVDDSSTDGTGDEIRRRFGDRVRVVSGWFGSAAAARNAAWRASRAPWIGFLDADDLWYPRKVERAAAALAAAPQARWFFSDGAFRNLEGETHPSWFEMWADVEEGYVGSPIAQLFEVNFVLTSSVVVSRALLEATRGFDETLTHAEDLGLWIRLARRAPAAATREPLVRYQHLPGGLTRKVEARLMGDVALFERLARDRGLSGADRHRARARVALARHKLAIAALKEGRTRDAWRHLPGAWLFPDRVLPALTLAAACALPAGWLGAIRRQHWATRPVVGPMGRPRRVELRASRGPHAAPRSAA